MLGGRERERERERERVCAYVAHLSLNLDHLWQYWSTLSGFSLPFSVTRENSPTVTTASNDPKKIRRRYALKMII